MPSVLDNKHGVEVQYLGEKAGYLYLPYYFRGGCLRYYTQGERHQRVSKRYFYEAYNHIARSRRMPQQLEEVARAYIAATAKGKHSANI